MTRRKTEQERTSEILEVCKNTNYRFIKFVNGYKNASSRIVMYCEKHGEWETSCDLVINGKNFCRKCRNEKLNSINSINQKEYEKRIADVCNSRGYTFIKWIETYHGVRTKALIQCAKHGQWVSSGNNITINKSFCKKCYFDSKKTPLNLREKEINEKCHSLGYDFLGWVDKYTNQYSKIKVKCQKHGEFVTTPTLLLHAGRRCAGCAATGFKIKNKASLYILRSVSGEYLKIGISNHVEKRIKILRKRTPFEFNVIEIYHSDGATIRSLEKDFHSHFESAGLTGFDGCTEWLKWNPNITTLIRMITG